MGLIQHLPTFIAGVRCEPEMGTENLVKSLDGKTSIPSSVTNASQLREALRYADECQKKLLRTPVSERAEVVKLVLNETARYRNEIAWGLSTFRGQVSMDSHWMCDLLLKWSLQVDELIGAVWDMDKNNFRKMFQNGKTIGNLSYRSKGKGAFITSSTMDGPPGIAAICHAILSGTHAIVRPSWKDVATHYLFEILHEHKLDHYAQLVRWPSSGGDTMTLNQQLLKNVEQAIVFCSDKTFEELVQGFSEENRATLRSKIHKYGTGLPIVVVTENTDLDKAAETIFLGARRGNGKFCLSHSPVLAHKNIYSSLSSKLIKLSANLKAGDLLDREVEKGKWDSEELQGLSRLATKFGGNIVQGTFQKDSMDVLILEDVSPNSPCLYQEFPGTLLAMIPFGSIEEAVSIAQKSLPMNGREAWTAANIFSSDQEYKELSYQIDSYHFLRGGVTSEPKFLLPHQGRYFAFDLSRRLTTED